MIFLRFPALKIVFWLILFVLTIIFIIHVINIILYSRNIEYVSVPIKSKKIGPAMASYKIAFIVDTHQIPRDNLKEVVNTLNDNIKPDLLLLGGDYPGGSALYRTMDLLATVKTNDGIYSVEGNHDTRTNLAGATKAHDIKLLLNEGLSIKENLFLAGTEDLWLGEPDVETSTQKATEDDFVLLLAHNPDTSMCQPMGDIDLVVSGHTHGGHVTLFGKWAPALSITKEISEYGQRFISGMCEGLSKVPVYVSNGTGYYGGIIPRVFARPQVIIFELQPEQ